MRFVLLAVVFVSACAPEDDSPGFAVPNLDADTVYVPGTKLFSPEEIAAGIKPSPAILAAAEAHCPTAKILSAKPLVSDQRRVGYFFSCP
jgi:hypothetical protein